MIIIDCEVKTRFAVPTVYRRKPVEKVTQPHKRHISNTVFICGPESSEKG